MNFGFGLLGGGVVVTIIITFNWDLLAPYIEALSSVTM